MQRTSTLESPPKRASPFKATLGAGSFYSKQKPLYLTPLERKVLKETKSSPSNQDQTSTPVASERKTKPKKTKKKEKVRVQKSNLKGYFTPKPNWSVNDKTSTDTVEGKKQPSITFSSLKMKNKPRIVVGAAFFGTGKKPASMYKPHAPKPKQAASQKPAAEKGTTPAQRERSPVRKAVFINKPRPNPQLLSKPQDCCAAEGAEQTPHPQPVSSHNLSQAAEVNNVVSRKPHSPSKYLILITDHQASLIITDQSALLVLCLN